MLSARQAAVYGQYSCEILSVQLCRTIGAGLLHCWYQGAAPFLALLFEVFKAMPNYRYSYAGLLVPECRTFLVLLLSLLDCYAEMQLILCKDSHFKNRESILSLYKLVFIGGSRDC